MPTINLHLIPPWADWLRIPHCSWSWTKWPQTSPLDELSVFPKPHSAAPVTASAPSNLIFSFILWKSVFEASWGLMEVVVVVVVVMLRGEGERGSAKQERRALGRVSSRQLCNALQPSLPLQREQEVILYPKYLPLSPSEPQGAFCCHHRPRLAFRRCFAWMFYWHVGLKKKEKKK